MWRGVLKVAVLAFLAFGLFCLGIAGVVRMRERAHQARCMWHLQQVGLKAMWTYADPEFTKTHANEPPEDIAKLLEHKSGNEAWTFPPGTLVRPNLRPEERLSWKVILLPELGYDGVRRKFDDQLGWAAEANQGAVATLVREYVCPSQFQPVPEGQPVVTHYVGTAGLGTLAATRLRSDQQAGFLRYEDPTHGDDMVRGVSQTITILETAVDLGPWAAGGPATVRGLDPARLPYVGPNNQFGGHPIGAFAAFADGSVRLQATSITPRVLEMLVVLRPLPESNP